MNGLAILAIWKYNLESTKEGKKVDVVCIADQNYGRSAVIQDHFRNFGGI